MRASAAKKELQSLKDPQRAKALQRFFKTGPGEYGEGDIFIGIKLPDLRSVAGRYSNLPLREISKLLESKIHEERTLALAILVRQFEGGDQDKKREIYNFYLKHTAYINNWDLVDISAPKIVGAYLKDKDRSVLYRLAHSEILWEKRISVLSTFWFIKNKDFKDALAIAAILLEDKYDLIHKAVGWMLREIGKISPADEERFLKKHYKKMPRTMLRYAIERFPENKRQAYLKGGDISKG